MQTYRARNPKKSPLWQCAHRHYHQFEEVYPERYQRRYGILRPIIPEVVHKFLECGDLARGFARIRCDHCQHEYLLAFSCKSRWFFPSCHRKNVQTTARFLLDHVLAPVPHRHYVLASDGRLPFESTETISSGSMTDQELSSVTTTIRRGPRATKSG